MWDKHIQHTRKKNFYTKLLSFSHKLVVGSSLIIIRRETENTIWKADSG